MSQSDAYDDVMNIPMSEGNLGFLNRRYARTILLVDDQDEVRAVTLEVLAALGYTAESARSAGEALTLFDKETHDAVLTDNSMPGMSGAEMARVIKRRSPFTPILMYTANPPSDLSGIDMFIQKPTQPLALKEGLDHLLSQVRA